MHIHILGIGGTFMGGLALIARAAGHKVTGCDMGVYPPMSDQLKEQNIEFIEGFSEDQINLNPDLYIIGNVVTRGNPLMEVILEKGLPYTSGPQWLGEHVLRSQHVIAVSGTHGKTTCTSMLTHILQSAGLNPNFLIGGIAKDFNISARFNSQSKFFVIEADEYDTAFFDKRSKFVHYHANTAIINNIEYDHADIFPDLKAIENQFHNFVRILPRNGTLIVPKNDETIDRILSRGLYCQKIEIGDGGTWSYVNISDSTQNFDILKDGQNVGHINWEMTGLHNIKNALSCIAAADVIGVKPALAIEALNNFSGIKRRMEVVGNPNNITIYDDFAHHPSAIATTIDGLRKKVGDPRIIAVFEPRSNTMKLGTMAKFLPEALKNADQIYIYGELHGKHALGWTPEEIFESQTNVHIYHEVDKLKDAILEEVKSGDHVVIMSNGSFQGLHKKLIKDLSTN
ncbi:UDP-N-acetylmuramate:L-alanyl-gamma-D-glutamyl-meso-diaminopimelate ligase [Taylorella equigenitalis]|uniref:UDP-N-acetylmuramate:L-alanyl-gamma-D-glutamyl- meso-diaminopimelate ligase n=1 Tax=Taylorella equigenitalis TaxID=29575 RepID=UPI0006C0A7D6|nr:UDP-N-acetylmuramate:L-alanyl-gamma-D-glutamyl-meso-diaminopimelate ligase [Taylorella equigenitalis]KOS59615.1 UDP-N-acetylmuramate:L-alanyl-gamma-D-glutamyl-meso-diaminopimelate ligase [Taylorella equigenitalis]